MRELRRQPGRIIEGRLAALVAVNRDIRGRTAGGWVHDPAIATVTPHLAAKATELMAMGGRRFPGESSPEVVRLATSSSTERRLLYEQGTYLPTNYWIVVRRRDFLSWARRDWLASPAERAAADQASIDLRAPGP